MQCFEIGKCQSPKKGWIQRALRKYIQLIKEKAETNNLITDEPMNL